MFGSSYGARVASCDASHMHRDLEPSLDRMSLEAVFRFRMSQYMSQ